MSAKEVALELIRKLPETASLEEIQYHLYVLQKIRNGEEEAAAGKAIPHEQVMKELAQWVESSGPPAP